MTVGLILVAIGFFLGFFKSLAPARLAFQCVGWGLVLYFGLVRPILAHYGVTLP